jgi:hypothetical protein
MILKMDLQNITNITKYNKSVVFKKFRYVINDLNENKLENYNESQILRILYDICF